MALPPPLEEKVVSRNSGGVPLSQFTNWFRRLPDTLRVYVVAVRRGRNKARDATYGLYVMTVFVCVPGDTGSNTDEYPLMTSRPMKSRP